MEPMAGVLSGLRPMPLATLPHSEALPQWRPAYQLENEKPLREASRNATHDVHCPCRKPRSSPTQPPPRVASLQSPAAGYG